MQNIDIYATIRLMDERRSDSLFDNGGKDSHLALNGVNRDFIMRFMYRCEWLENGCVIYTGGNTVRMPRGMRGIKFTTPRRAAYYIDHARLPTNEIKASCKTKGCILPAHIIAGRPRRSEPFVVTKRLLVAVLFDRAKSCRYIARKHGIDRKLAKRILDLGLNFPLPPKEEREKPLFRSAGF